jgi:hypothetical protein
VPASEETLARWSEAALAQALEEALAQEWAAVTEPRSGKALEESRAQVLHEAQ